MDTSRDIADWVIKRARELGATAADVLIVTAESISAGVRLGEIEKVKSSRERKLGLRIFVGESSAIASTAELRIDSLKVFVADTIALARAVSPDRFAGLPEPELCSNAHPNLELVDSATGVISADDALAIARRAEEAALSFSPKITNSEGAEFGSGWYEVMLANSAGFLSSYEATNYSLSVVPIARSDDSMQRDYWYTSGHHFDALESPEQVGRRAAERVMRRLGARKIPTTRAPVIFEAETAASLLSALSGAISGDSLYMGTSFLLDRLNDLIAAPEITIVDDPLRVRGLASKPFDGEGVRTSRKTIVERGRLVSYLLDCYSARRLGLQTTGNAARGVGSAPTPRPSNFYLEPGPFTQEQIIASVKRGLLVTELFGFGVNLVTGDYSRGAVGLWIENGEIAYPVEEITIAGNLKEMLTAVEMVGNDLVFRSAISAPTIKLAEMTIAGL